MILGTVRQGKSQFIMDTDLLVFSFSSYLVNSCTVSFQLLSSSLDKIISSRLSSWLKMHYYLAITAALAVGVVARPANKPTGFIIKQVKNPNFHRNGPAEFAKALNKWLPYSETWDSPAIERRGDGSVVTNPASGSGDGADQEYLCPVNINGQVFKLDFDTGSSDLWVRGPTIPASGSHTAFAPKNGDNPIPNETWNITYGDKTGASGIVYSETVNVGPVAVTKQAVEVATSISPTFQRDPADGLLGLAFSGINTVKTNGQRTPQNTFFQNAITQKILNKPVFGVSLKYKAAGSYDFGFVRSTTNTTLAYTPVDRSHGFWGFTPSGVQIGGKAVSSSSSLTGIADTGTTLLLLPNDIVASYYQGTGAALANGHYTFPCSTTLPDFQVVIGAATITIPGKFINYDTVSKGSTTCFGGIQPSSQLKMNIYGDIFLKAAYVVFDATVGAPKLGFAPGS